MDQSPIKKSIHPKQTIICQYWSVYNVLTEITYTEPKLMPLKKQKQFLVTKTKTSGPNFGILAYIYGLWRIFYQGTWTWWWMRFQRILASEVVNSRIDSCNKVGTHSRAFRSSLRGGWEEIPGRINGPPQIPATSPRSKRCRERLTI